MKASALCSVLLIATVLPGAARAATLEERLSEVGPASRARIRPHFAAAGLAYPPRRAALVGYKAERRLEVYGADESGELRFVRSYPVLAASGGLGPKLRQGDRQVPEGVYGISGLNPDSEFHLSLRIDYPNAHDRRRALEDGRDDLGGDIMIHGDSVSVGCLAIGDRAIEELFVLAADTGPPNVRVILSPVDFRRRALPREFAPSRPWVPALHREIRAALRDLPCTDGWLRDLRCWIGKLRG